VIRQLGRGINFTLLHWSQTFLDLLYPPTCVGCGDSGADWCDRCNESLRILPKPICIRCGSPLPSIQNQCVRCSDFPGILMVRSYAYYEGPLHNALLHLKYRPNKRLAKIMGHWLAALSLKEGMAGSMIVTVPLGRNRLKQRGYNQVDLVADGMAEDLGIENKKKALTRIRETKSQVGLDPVARRNNVQNAFRADRQILMDQKVFLLDDLFTTGATMLACTKALQEAGVRYVFGLTVARAR
jgi:ComF family protein